MRNNFTIKWGRVAVGCLLACVIFACSSTGQSNDLATSPSLSMVQVKDIYSGNVDNKRIMIKGRYLGWAKCDPAQNKTIMLTRSDWVLADTDSAACIYVTGGFPKIKPYGQGHQNRDRDICIIADVKKVKGKYILVLKKLCENRSLKAIKNKK